MRTFDEIRELLAQKLSKEKKRLKTFGTKADSFNLANSITRYVQALMAESRAKELKRLKKVLDKQPSQGNVHKIFKHYEERYKATSQMAGVLNRFADKTEKERPWRSKTEQAIDKDERKHRKHKHGNKGSSRSSRH